jgi:hypothetical protein
MASLENAAPVCAPQTRDWHRFPAQFAGNWLPVPGFATDGHLARQCRPIFVLPDEVLPHHATNTGFWLPKEIPRIIAPAVEFGHSGLRHDSRATSNLERFGPAARRRQRGIPRISDRHRRGTRRRAPGTRRGITYVRCGRADCFPAVLVDDATRPLPPSR